MAQPSDSTATQIEEIKDLQDQLVDLIHTSVSVQPASHNVRRLRRDAQYAAALAEQLADKLGALDPMHMTAMSPRIIPPV